MALPGSEAFVKKIFSIIYKDTRIRFASPVEWMFFLILPVIFILILSGGTGVPEDRRIQLEVVDLAESKLSKALISELETSTSVKPIPTSYKDAVSDFESRQASAILVIPENFNFIALQEGKAEVVFKQEENNLNALIFQQAVEVALGRISSLVDIANASLEKAIAFRSFSSEEDEQAYFDEAFKASQSLMADAPQRVNSLTGSTEDAINYDPRTNSTFGQLVTWVYIPLIGLSAMFADERERGTLRRLLVTPTQNSLYIGSTVLGQVLTAVLQMAILVSFGLFALKIDLGNSILALVLITICTALSAAALGTMLGTFVKTSGQANGLSIIIGMVMAMMGGCWYPIELFPDVVRKVVKIFPTTWAMQGFLNITVRGQGLEGIWLECLVLLGFTLVFFVIGVWRFKYE